MNNPALDRLHGTGRGASSRDMILETVSLTKNYGRVPALDSCTLSVSPGEIVGLLGPNGSGKTTLIRLLMGFLRPTHGKAQILGRDCYRDAVAVHRSVGYLPGEVRLFRQMRGGEVLRFFAQAHPAADLERSRAIAERFCLDLSRQVAYCSTGMRQKLGLAVVLSLDAPVLILDEPTGNLDPTARSEVLSLIRQARAAGTTILLSSHVFSETESVCDRVCILKQGKLVHEQKIGELKRHHAIRMKLSGPLPPLPGELSGKIRVHENGNGRVEIFAAVNLKNILGWLATLPVEEIEIEPKGLEEIYRRFHAEEKATT